MALWQVMKNEEPTGAFVDDGYDAEPGDEGFTTEAALALAELAGGDAINYVGPSTR